MVHDVPLPVLEAERAFCPFLGEGVVRVIGKKITPGTERLHSPSIKMILCRPLHQQQHHILIEKHDTSCTVMIICTLCSSHNQEDTSADALLSIHAHGMTSVSCHDHSVLLPYAATAR